MKSIFFIFVAFVFSGCASMRAGPMTYSDQSSGVLKQSLLNASNISEEAIQKILNSKIVLPSRSRLAVIRLTNNSQYDEFRYNRKNVSSKKYDMDDAFVEQFYNTLNSSKNFTRIIPVPLSLLPTTVDLKGLRVAAVTVQADLLLIINSNTDTNWDFKWSEGSTFGKGTTLVEAFLMDTRTGIVATTGVYSETAEVQKDDKKDYDLDETMRRARLESEKKVFNSLAKDVIDFIDKSADKKR